MKNCCDLHTHSAYSDGTWMPDELIAEAERIGLSAIALTDHNTVAGLPELFRAAKGKNVEAVGGVELSTDYGEVELHIVGLFIQEKHFDKIEALVAELGKRKNESNIALVAALNRGGYDVNLDEIKAKTPKKHINRAHIASALMEKGYENADITIITDGECRISDDFAEKFRNTMLKYKATVTGILLDKDRPCGKTLEPFCDKIYHSKDITEDEIAQHILKQKAS